MNIYLVEISICIVCFNKLRSEQSYQTLYFQLAHNKFSFVFFFKLNNYTLLFCILSENKYFNYILYFCILIILNCRFPIKVTCEFLLLETIKELSKLKTFKPS